MSNLNRALGLDLGGAASPTTGFVVLEGGDRPRISAAGQPGKSADPRDAEARLLALVDEWTPAVVAIDAPLTLPPCLTCPSYCRGPGELCELQAAQHLWERGRNPVSGRLCELLVEDIVGERPMPTMQLGVITARAVAFARRLANRGTPPSVVERGELLEVYPRATLRRLGQTDDRLLPKARKENTDDYHARLLSGFAAVIDGVDDHRDALRNGHVLDALVAAYTGWLGQDRLASPPAGFNVSSGWIWFPRKPRN